jgi:hypothetical protein
MIEMSTNVIGGSSSAYRFLSAGTTLLVLTHLKYTREAHQKELEKWQWVRIAWWYQNGRWLYSITLEPNRIGLQKSF